MLLSQLKILLTNTMFLEIKLNHSSSLASQLQDKMEDLSNTEKTSFLLSGLRRLFSWIGSVQEVQKFGARD
jgi:hypothetical protein